MDLGESVRSLEGRLTELKERVRREQELLHLETSAAVKVVRIISEKANNVALEALSEIRHIDVELQELASAMHVDRKAVTRDRRK